MHCFHFLAGANTARGFYSCFDAIVPKTRQKRVYYLKGGPGVGKSTLMKRFAKSAEEKGLEVTYYHCSSDPDSLDGVSVPALGVGMMDGTAPHVYDPAVPGARDTLVSLGDFLDEKALAPHTADIVETQRKISERFQKCCRYLAASEQVLRAGEIRENPAKARELAEEMTRSLPIRGGTGGVQKLFASAFTPKGLFEVTDLKGLDQRTSLQCPFGANATGLMKQITEKAIARGLRVIQLLDPLSPEEIRHVLIPDHGIAFCADEKTTAGECLSADRLFDIQTAPEHEQRFDRSACELLWQRATEQLTAAKKLHDDLEQFYIPHMDFAKWQQTLDKIVERELN